ncbi:MAG TPA: LamG-like jellyroll fold domain-containing protein [Chitinivibrionales bacterium]|nr:LamG-like jellyroll fold domain-containing protein [Chitinivibrionales bacterium]
MKGRIVSSLSFKNHISLHSGLFSFTISQLNAFLLVVCISVVPLWAAKIHQWLLDDAAGTVVVDTIGNSNGVASGGPLFGQPGPNAAALPRAMYFDGVDDGVSVSGLPGFNTFTVSFWMKPGASGGCPVARSNFNNPWSLQLASNSNAAYATLTCWINDFTTQTQHFSQSVPLDQWVQVAFVLNKSKDSLWLYVNGAPAGKDGGLANYGDNGSQPLFFGRRADGAYYQGWLAGVSLWDSALTGEQVMSVYVNESGRVSGQYPENLSFLSPGNPRLSWLASPGAISHDLYLGTDEAAVTSATTGSASFKGSLAAPSYTASLTLNATYYWRVDEVFPGSVRVTGDVLSFVYCNPADLFRSWGTEALNELNSGFKRADNLYAGSVKSGVQGDVAFVWGQAVTWMALNATASWDDTSYRQSTWKTFWPAFKNRYRYFYNNLWAYNAYSNQTGTADRYLDDNGHIIVALMELYNLTKDTALVNEAETVMQFEMHYENNAPGFGGMPWHENMPGASQNQTLNGVASTLATQAALMVYQVTKKQVYLDFARGVYDYLHAHGMVRPDGIVYESMAPDFTINKGFLSYVTDYFLESDLIFFRVYNDSSYLDMARKRADAIYTERIDKATGALGETGQWGGYSHVRALHSLYSIDPDPKWRNHLFGILNYLHGHTRDNGWYGERWDMTYAGLDTAQLDILWQAAPVIGYMHGADSALWSRQENFTEVQNHPSIHYSSVKKSGGPIYLYNILGRKVGEAQSVRDMLFNRTLGRGIYIMRQKNMPVAKTEVIFR